jgi:nitrate/TMAO reductase-like tetraheme cytochrome c subunit
VFVLIPAMLLLGLLLIPIGRRLERRRREKDPTAPDDWPVVDFRLAGVRRTALVVTGLTAVNVIIVLLAGYGSLRWMESPTFCGQTCHTPMRPQFSAWSGSVHGSTACVQCHIGEGPRAFVRAKLAGVRQLVHVATGSYPRPIPPGTQMPEGAQAETCRGCHRPERGGSDRIRVSREYAEDEGNTETATVLQMYVGAGSVSGRSIHWHANPDVRVEYVATDPANETIPYVKVTDATGRVREFVAKDASNEAIRAGTRRTMDCIDCHNTVGHPIAPTAEQAVDQAIAAGLVSRRLPHARREGVKLLKASYASEDEAMRAIERGFRDFYQTGGVGVDDATVRRSAAALQTVYRRNVFPAMKVAWGSYPSNKGHFTATGCFRCHDDSHADQSGATISSDCDYCHKQIDTPAAPATANLDRSIPLRLAAAH